MPTTSAINTILFGALLGGLIALTGCGGGQLTPEELATQAISGKALSEREAAASKLVELGPEGVPHLRKILAESSDPSVIALAISGLGLEYDFQSMPAIIDAMEHESSLVRGQAGVVVAKLLGRDRRFRPDLPERDRERIIRFTREDWEEVSRSEFFEDFKRQVRGEE